MKKLIIGIIAIFFVGASCSAQSNVTLAGFKERYNEIEATGFQDDWIGAAAAWASFAGSNVTLARFKERYNEIEATGFQDDWIGAANAWASFAAR